MHADTTEHQEYNRGFSISLGALVVAPGVNRLCYVDWTTYACSWKTLLTRNKTLAAKDIPHTNIAIQSDEVLSVLSISVSILYFLTEVEGEFSCDPVRDSRQSAA